MTTVIHWHVTDISNIRWIIDVYQFWLTCHTLNLTHIKTRKEHLWWCNIMLLMMVITTTSIVMITTLTPFNPKENSLTSSCHRHPVLITIQILIWKSSKTFQTVSTQKYFSFTPCVIHIKVQVTEETLPCTRQYLCESPEVLSTIPPLITQGPFCQSSDEIGAIPPEVNWDCSPKWWRQRRESVGKYQTGSMCFGWRHYLELFLGSFPEV